MAAFPKVLEKVPEAKLVVAGANHHTRAGYWESVRDAQPPHLPIEFRGYVAEDEIPELFQSTSALVLPYDSATGSSGPAHQACEYGVPIVCADIPDFRGMVTDEDMAVRFYRVGDADHLAEQLIRILSSPAVQREMAEQNFAAGLQMTMKNVIANYLRWFRLHQAKRAFLEDGELIRPKFGWRRNGHNPGWDLGSAVAQGNADPAESGDPDELSSFAQQDAVEFYKQHGGAEHADLNDLQ